MIHFHQNDQPPHLLTYFSSHVTVEDLNEEMPAFEAALQRQRPGFVMMTDCTELEEIDPEAKGVLFYLMRRVLEARPAAVLGVNQDRDVTRRFESFARRLQQEGKMHFFESSDQADAFLAGFRASHKE